MRQPVTRISVNSSLVLLGLEGQVLPRTVVSSGHFLSVNYNYQCTFIRCLAMTAVIGQRADHVQ